MSFQVLLDAPGKVTGRLQVAKLGEFEHAKYGTFTIGRDDVESWRANLDKLPGKRAPIDLDHSSDRSPRNTEAAGWITGIGWDGDTPMADVEWTTLGKQAIEDGRYAFFSPTYGDVKDERGATIKNALLGGALTNRPHLNMATISLASAGATGELDDLARATVTLDGATAAKNPFSSDELNKSVMEAWFDPEVRPRLVQHVAALQGINTAEAHNLIFGRVFNELGATAGGNANPTLEQALDHLSHPSFNPKAPSMTTDSNTLDGPVGALFAFDYSSDREQAMANRGRLNRVVRTISHETGLSWVDAMSKLQDGFAQTGPDASVRHALEAANVSVSDTFADTVRLLDRRDQEVAAEAARETANLPQERVDPQGRVLLDTDARAALRNDPRVQEERLERARRFDPDRYGGEPGRARFLDEDRSMADANRDLVRTLEFPLELAAARNRVANVARNLDAAIAAGHDHRSKVRLLDAEVGAAMARRAAAAAQPVTGGEDTVQALRLLEGNPPEPIPPVVLDAAPTNGVVVTDEARAMDRRVKAELERRGLGLMDYPAVLTELMDGGVVSEPEPSADKSLNQRVLDQIEAEGLSMSDYPKVLDQIIRGT